MGVLSRGTPFANNQKEGMQQESDLTFEQVGNLIVLRVGKHGLVSFKPQWFAELKGRSRPRCADYLRHEILPRLTKKEAEVLQSADWSRVPVAVQRYYATQKKHPAPPRAPQSAKRPENKPNPVMQPRTA